MKVVRRRRGWQAGRTVGARRRLASKSSGVDYGSAHDIGQIRTRLGRQRPCSRRSSTAINSDAAKIPEPTRVGGGQISDQHLNTFNDRRESSLSCFPFRGREFVEDINAFLRSTPTARLAKTAPRSGPSAFSA